jgi:stage II sporulation protein D
VAKRVLTLCALAALASAGAASAMLAGAPARPGATTTATTAATTTGTTTGTTTTTVTTTVSSASAAIVLNGHGWGHGLGMSQWGAYGYAKHGWTYDRILAHYYTGTTLGPAPVRAVRVLLAEGKKPVVLSSTTPWRVTDATGVKRQLAPGKLALGPGLKVAGMTLASPLAFAAGTTPLLVGGKPYRGRVVVTSDGKKLQAVNTLGLEAYLKGVVASEMPSAWSPEALKAQAVAARSYALATLAPGRDYDLYSDTRSQVYGGITAESPASSQAVDDTAGEVVLYGGKVATTYFFSTSGGRTVSAADATGRAVPYLVSVADPYDGASPYHNWGPVLIDAAKAAKQLKVPGPLLDLRTTPGPSGRVQRASLVGPLGETTVPGTTLRTALGLRSTWFSAGWLALTPPAAPVTYGGAATLGGVARAVPAVTLETRPAGGLWTSVGLVAPDGTGAFSTIVKPQVTTEYRLSTGTIRAALVKVPVAPAVDATVTLGSATGRIRPPLAGAAVQLQRQDGVKWTTVASGTTDALGAFTLVADATSGSYRVRAAPGHGLVPGFSQAVCC